MQFVYIFGEAEQSAGSEVLAKYGLDSRAKDGWQTRQVAVAAKGARLMPAGPGADREWTTLAISLEGRRLGFFPEEQTWRRVENAGHAPFWLGWQTERPPTPEELLRPRAATGYPVELADGNHWIVPVLRRYPEGTGLPSTIELRPSGEVEARVQAEFRELFDRAGEYAQVVFGAEGMEVNDADERLRVDTPPWPLVYDALAVNYRVGWPEINALELFTDQHAAVVGMAMVDAWTYLHTLRPEGVKDEPKNRQAPV